MTFDPGTLSRYPTTSGVYLMYDDRREILYIGKAVNLKQRLKNYFSSSGDNRLMIPHLVAQIASIETIVVPSEKDALFLERELIQKHQPKYNILLKDDKSFVSLYVNTDHRFAQVTVERRHLKQKKKGVYFGPYPDGHAARRTLGILQSIYPLRQCSDRELSSRKRPCILHALGKCAAPCVGLCSDTDYQALVKGALQFLEGKNTAVLKELTRKMQTSSDHQEYEKAASYRDLIETVKKTTHSKKDIVYSTVQEADVIGVFAKEGLVVFTVWLFRKGRLIHQDLHSFTLAVDQLDNALQTFLMQYYHKETSPPKELIIPFTLPDHEAMVQLLKDHITTVHVPKQKERYRLLQAAMHAAKNALTHVQIEHIKKEEDIYHLQEVLALRQCPLEIDCIDTSHLGGSDPVASIVRYSEGKKNRSMFRLYKVRQKESEDYRSMEEVLDRLFSDPERELPHLLLVDGGKGQLGIAEKILQKHNIVTVEVAAFTKELGRHDKGMTAEKVYIPGKSEPIPLDARSSVLFFLQRIRDEAHRFAITYHRKRRSKRLIKTALDDIPGIGPIKRKRLLQQFHSVDTIKQLSLEELCTVKGISKKDAEAILDYLNK